MDKEFWFMPSLCFGLMVCSALVGVIYGHNAGVEQALERVCNQTNGKYDFWQILMICVIPFIPLDLVKIVIASLVGMRFRKYIDKELDLN